MIITTQEADVQSDYMQHLESIPPLPVQDRPGDILEVYVTGVYSPSHFWLARLGLQHHIAMENILDEMNKYYKHGEGRRLQLSSGSVRVGQYCASCYEGGWWRCVIVKIVDRVTVKVRQVDYGTVVNVTAAGLRPLPRKWAQLPAQAQRARLATVQPPADARSWPRAATGHFQRMVLDRWLLAKVVAVDIAAATLEVHLIVASGALINDRWLSTELVRSGNADTRTTPALRTSECYLDPSFTALEEGDTHSLES